jgi:hypothetical protein
MDESYGVVSVLLFHVLLSNIYIVRQQLGTFIYISHILEYLPSTSNLPGVEKNTSGVKE